MSMHGKLHRLARTGAACALAALVCAMPASGAELFGNTGEKAPPESAKAAHARGAVREVAGALGVAGLCIGLSVSPAAPLFLQIATTAAGAGSSDQGTGHGHGHGHGQ